MPQDTYYIKTHYQDKEQLYLIHRNKYREAAKMRRQSNTAKMKEQIKTLGKKLNEMEVSNLSCRVQNNVYEDAQGT